MDAYKYRAISRDGAKVEGVVEAFDEYAAVAKIKETCSIVTKITKAEPRKKAGRDILGTGRINEKELAVTCSQFEIILTAGIPIIRAVELIAEQTTSRELKTILKNVAGDVSAGFGLAQSFENKGRGKLPLTFIETIRAGEETGTLDTSFKKLHEYYDKSSKIKGKVKSAMVYPVFTCAVAVVVVAIIMIVAVPTFVGTFATMGITLPLPTKILIAVSTFLTKFWPIILAAAAALGIAYKLYGRTEKGRLNIARGKLRFPVLGSIAVTRNAAQFASTLSTLVSAGLPLVNAVGATGRTLDNHYIAVQIMNIVPKIEEGRSLGASIRDCAFIPDLLKEMTGVGEETGSLENTLDVIGAYYDNETEIKSAKALALMEPVIICILAAVVVFILLSVYLPLFSLYGGIG